MTVHALHPDSVDSTRTIDVAFAQHRKFFRRAARFFAEEDRAMAEDLVQEGLIRLWEIDPCRFDPSDARDMLYLRRDVAAHMHRVQRRMRRLQREFP